MIIMRTASGKQCHINNTRAAVYGYDQRVELVGANRHGSVRQPQAARSQALSGPSKRKAAEPYLLFFLERYNEAFMAEIDAFVDCCRNRPRAIARI